MGGVTADVQLLIDRRCAAVLLTSTICSNDCLHFTKTRRRRSELSIKRDEGNHFKPALVIITTNQFTLDVTSCVKMAHENLCLTFKDATRFYTQQP